VLETGNRFLNDREVERLLDLVLAGLEREYPNFPGHVFRSDEDLQPPRRIHPVFFGHFDWHSSVHGHWALVRLAKLFPKHERAGDVRRVLERRFDAKGLQEEADYLREHPRFERMYGWAWALRLVTELRTWDDGQAQEWARRFGPLQDVVVDNARGYLRVLAQPIRCGFHPESAFPLAQMLDYALAVGDVGFFTLLRERSLFFYKDDRDYPVAYEPSGHDFFSAGLNEADLMRRLLTGKAFANWLDGLFPGLRRGHLGNLLTPVEVADAHDGHLVHLAGLNLSRAWTMRGIARALSTGDKRREILLGSAARHQRAGLDLVFSGSYEGEHWLGSFAIYLLSEAGL